MSQEAVERLLGRLITDERFRIQAQDLLGSACRQEGYLLSPEEMKMVAGTDLAKFSELAGQISPGLRRATCCSTV
jgi:hypothetical protein